MAVPDIVLFGLLRFTQLPEFSIQTLWCSVFVVVFFDVVMCIKPWVKLRKTLKQESLTTD